MVGESGEVISFEFLDDYYFENKKLTDEQNQETFKQSLEQLRQSHFVELPDTSQLIHHRGGSSRHVEQTLESSGGSALFTPRFIQGVSPYRYPDRVDFEVRPYDRLGRDKSRHQVFFGELKGRWFHEQEVGQVSVAVKPIPNNTEERPQVRNQVLHEIGFHQYLKRYDIPSLDVLGVVLTGSYEDDEPYGFVLTRTEPDIETLNTISWGNLDREKAGQKISHAVDTLALLHSHHVFHGDSEFRNIAVADSGRSLRIIDLEYARSLRDDPGNISKLADRMDLDFSYLAKSVDEYLGYLFHDENEQKQPIETYGFLLNQVLLPYYDRLLEIGIRPGDPLAQAFDQVVMRKLTEAQKLLAIQDKQANNPTDLF